MHAPETLLAYAALTVIGLIALIGPLRMNAFVALTLASLFIGCIAGMSLGQIGDSFQKGVGAMLGSIAVVVGMGVILGKLLAQSGGAEVIARRLAALFGPERADWTMFAVAWLVGLPVFFTVGLVLLTPIAASLVRESKLPAVRVMLPLLAGLSVAHGLVPPHPGPMAALILIHAKAGQTITYAVLIGLPVAWLGGPVFGQWLSQRLALEMDPAPLHQSAQLGARTPGFGLALTTMLLPVLLILSSTVGDLLLPKDSAARNCIDFLGHPVTAMTASVLAGFYVFGFGCGLTRKQLLEVTDQSLGPAAMILLVVGAGGGFNQILHDSGVGSAIASLVQKTNVPPLVFAWIMAAAIRIATGSATVAITTAAGLVVPLLESHPPAHPELYVCAMGAGSLILSHVNDGGFWFVKEYLGLNVRQTFQIWTTLETLVAVAGLALVLIVNALF